AMLFERPRALLPVVGFGPSSSFFFFFPRQSTFQTFRKEVCLTDHSMYPGPCAPTCCECQTRFGGRLPVPRAEAALPYWVPLSLRPPKQRPPWTRVPGTTAGASAVTMAASCSGGSSSRHFTGTGHLFRAAPPTCCPWAS
uniref:Chromosome 16 open reading frame 95 n=1 Tax=Microcebus murinus TaxID=30608 RepID=A0A8C5YA67_MICMU